MLHVVGVLLCRVLTAYNSDRCQIHILEFAFQCNHKMGVILVFYNDTSVVPCMMYMTNSKFCCGYLSMYN